MVMALHRKTCGKLGIARKRGNLSLGRVLGQTLDGRIHRSASEIAAKKAFLAAGCGTSPARLLCVAQSIRHVTEEFELLFDLATYDPLEGRLVEQPLLSRIGQQVRQLDLICERNRH